MNRFRVEIVPSVLNQIREQVVFISRHSVINALAWEDRPLLALEGLADFHGHAIDNVAHKRIGGSPRKLIFEKTYLVHYEIDQDASLVRVVNFRHGARQPRAGEP